MQDVRGPGQQPPAGTRRSCHPNLELAAGEALAAERSRTSEWAPLQQGDRAAHGPTAEIRASVNVPPPSGEPRGTAGAGSHLLSHNGACGLTPKTSSDHPAGLFGLSRMSLDHQIVGFGLRASDVGWQKPGPRAGGGSWQYSCWLNACGVRTVSSPGPPAGIFKAICVSCEGEWS